MNSLTTKWVCVRRIIVAKCKMSGLIAAQSYYAGASNPGQLQKEIEKEIAECELEIVKHSEMLKLNSKSEESYQEVMNKIESDIEFFLEDLTDESEEDTRNIYEVLVHQTMED